MQRLMFFALLGAAFAFDVQTPLELEQLERASEAVWQDREPEITRRMYSRAALLAVGASTLAGAWLALAVDEAQTEPAGSHFHGWPL